MVLVGLNDTNLLASALYEIWTILEAVSLVFSGIWGPYPLISRDFGQFWPFLVDFWPFWTPLAELMPLLEPAF